jgi:diguanylate cyclase (GGDEF)-like protein/PAS domain S-box-containing protein
MFIFDDNEIAWITQNRAMARLLAVVVAFLFGSYTVVDWLINPTELANTLPWRLLGAITCLSAIPVLASPRLLKWAPLHIAIISAIITMVVSLIFLGLLRDVHIALVAQMQVLMTLAFFGTLRSAMRAMIPALLVSFNVGLWWNNVGWEVFALVNYLLVGGLAIVVVVSEMAYRSFLHKRRLEAELELHAAIVQTSDDAIVGRTLDGKVTSWNVGAQRLFGYSADEMTGKTLAALFPPQRKAEEQELLDRIARGTMVNHFETVRVCKDGSLRDVSVSISPLRDANGAITGASTITRDISDRTRNERTLHEKDTLFRTAIETTSDGFWAVDTTGHLIDANQAYSDLSGYSRDELLKMRISDLEANETTDDTGARIEKVMREGSDTFETSHRRKDNSVWPVEVITSYSPINDGRFFVFTKDLTERKRAQALTWQQANFDSLTQLPNRALLFDRLSKECAIARRTNTSVALLFIDLDGFKQVNDNFGHAAGDQVLQIVARRWLDCVREADTVARLGGDEFAVVLGGLQDLSAVATMAEKLIAVVSSDVALSKGKTCHVGASIGISIYPTDAQQVDSLISLADAAMYKSKARGKGAFTFSSPQAPHDSTG